jgi:arylsulfatase
MPTQGTLTLHVRDQPVGQATIMTQPGKFGLGGGGLIVGRSGAEPVTDDFVGEAPWRFVGGTIERILIDVSGDSFTDLAAEARAAFARQ